MQEKALNREEASFDKAKNILRATPENTQSDARLVELLLAEIDDQLREHEWRYQRPEWTPWAIATAVATLLWLLLTQVLEHQVHWYGAMAVYVTVSVIADASYLVVSALRSFSKPIEKPRFHRPRTLLEEGTVYLGVAFFRAAAVSVLVLVLPLLSPQVSWIIAAWESYIALAVFSGFFLLVYGVPFPLEYEQSKWRKSFALLANTSFALSASALGLVGVLRSSQLAVKDWQAGLLLGGISFLIVLLARTSRQSTLVNQLKQVRQRLRFGEVSPESARSEIRLLLKGLTLGQALDRSLGPILVEHGRISEAYARLLQVLSVVSDMLDPGPGDISAEQQTAIGALLENVDGITQEIKDSLKNSKRLQAGLNARLRVLSRMFKVPEEDLRELSGDLELARNSWETRPQEVIDKLDELKQRFFALQANSDN